MGVRGGRKDATGWLERLEVSPPGPVRTFSSLSGRNQQKVVLAHGCAAAQARSRSRS